MVQKKSSTKKDAHEQIIAKHNFLSSLETPAYYIKERQKYEYVDEGFMRFELNRHYPEWNWEILSWQVIESSIAIHGRLTINDCGVMRSYDAIASHRIALSKDGSGHVDLGNDLKAANSDCFKVAVNRLCNVSDDVYRKSILNGYQLDTIEGLIEQLPEVSVQRKVIEGIRKKKINSTNYDSSVERLQQIIKGEKENE